MGLSLRCWGSKSRPEGDASRCKEHSISYSTNTFWRARIGTAGPRRYTFSSGNADDDDEDDGEKDAVDCDCDVGTDEKEVEGFIVLLRGSIWHSNRK